MLVIALISSIVSTVISWQSYSRATKSSKNDGALTALYELIAGIVILTFMPFDALDVKFTDKLKSKLSKYKDIEILGVANTNEDERRMINELNPEIVITDIVRDDEVGGWEIIEEYSKKGNRPQFLILSAGFRDCFITRNENVIGYIEKYPEINYSRMVARLRIVKFENYKKEQDIKYRKRKL